MNLNLRKKINEKVKALRLAKNLAVDAGKKIRAMQNGKLSPKKVLSEYSEQGKCKICGELGILIKGQGVCINCVLRGKK